MTRSELRALLGEPIRPTRIREVAGFVVAPLAGTLVLILLVMILPKLDNLASLDGEELVRALLLSVFGPGALMAMVIFPWTLVVALPAYLVLSDLGKIHCASIHASAMLVGASLGALVVSINDAWSGAAFVGLGASALCGLFAGFVFYRIISGPRRAAPPRPR